METIDTRNRKSGTWAVPVAIIIAGALIAGALYLGNGVNSFTATADERQQEAQVIAALEKMKPVNSEDHIRGSRDAAVTIVEYSDFECPFCKAFHPTMQRVMNEYGSSGKVAWVYRHFPLDQLHPVKARKEAVATECAAEIGGNDAFWSYADRFFELTPSNNQTDIDSVLPQIAREIGLDETAFSACLESGKYDSHVQSDYDNAIATGGRGTPWSIIVTKNGTRYPLSGAQPYEAVAQLIELALDEK